MIHGKIPVAIEVGVLASESSWHFQDLKRVSTSLSGEIDLHSVDFSTLSASVENEHAEQFSDRSGSLNSLNALIVRTMPRGSLQQIVFRMDALHRLADSGVRIVNSPRSVEIAIDKYLSLSLMVKRGLPVPAFSVCQTVEQGIRAFERLGGNVILKPIFGSMGKHVFHFDALDGLVDEMERFVAAGEVLYLQKFVDHGETDIRVLVVGEEVFSMRRTSPNGGWLTNVAQGGGAEALDVTENEIQLAKAAAKINGCQIAGVDLVYPVGEGDPMVLEVNASPGWEAIQKVCEKDIARSVLRLVTRNLRTE